ncbi:MFS transporter [Elioraea thermophila]|uniref:MFS transporter n=1 Tax=Elioraea thermophila TaxID=2185104 RepID=UPI000DF3ACCB|nr:MFS transporter [Elioraea thermophila]
MAERDSTGGRSRHDGAVIALIAAAHFLSHFYQLVLPPLLPMMRAELGLSYTALGSAIAVLSAVTAFGQTPIGVWADRTGAAPWLVAGNALMVLGTLGFAAADGMTMLILAAVLGGLGNATIHPCDYAILSGSIRQERMGRAFSLHTAAGYAGFAAGPPAMILLEAWLGWRGALVAAALAGIPCVVAIALFARRLRSEAKPRRELPPAHRLLSSRPILLLFLFMTLIAMGGFGAQTYMVAALPKLHGVSIATAATAMTVWLVSSTLGTLAGGWIADRTGRHVAVVTAMMLSAGVLVAALGLLPLGAAGIIALAAGAGFGLGVVMPSRDLIVRETAPPGTAGQVFGFVSSGLPLGQALAPAPLGLLMDVDLPSVMFVACGVVLAAAVLTVHGARASRRVVPAPAE